MDGSHLRLDGDVKWGALLRSLNTCFTVPVEILVRFDQNTTTTRNTPKNRFSARNPQPTLILTNSHTEYLYYALSHRSDQTK